MTTTLLAPPENVVELLERLGNIPAHRVRMKPLPGTATEADVIAAEGSIDKRICELIDGVLVEKAVGLRESLLASWFAILLDAVIRRQNLGMVSGEQGMIRMVSGRIRIPDVAYFSWDRFPNRRIPDEPIPDLAPDLAIEILSESNTPEEMRLKREDYFASRVSMIWEVDPTTRTIAVYTGIQTPPTILSEKDVLSGGNILPGFMVPVRDIFAELDRHG